MKPSDVQSDLMPGLDAPRGRLSPAREAAGYAVQVLSRTRTRIASTAHRDACRAGGDHKWHPAAKPEAERGEWPPGPWFRCAGCGFFTTKVTP
jgi:hypothetical protein